MPITIKDLAVELGITYESVSAALNGRKGVSEATRSRVVTLAKERGYYPSAIGRSLQKGRTDIVGFYSGLELDARNWFLAEIIGGLQRGCAENSKTLLVYPTFGVSSPEDVNSVFRKSHADGLIIVSTNLDQVIPNLDPAFPLIALGNQVGTMPSVTVDGRTGGRLLCQHLAERGHHKVVYYIGSAASSVSDRYTGFIEAATEFGVQVDLHFEWPTLKDVRRFAENYSAFVGWEDKAAFAMIGYCETLGIECPKELAIVGFNGIDSPIPSNIKLTTIRAPWAAAAQEAVSLMSALVEGGRIPLLTTLPVELIEGTTT